MNKGLMTSTKIVISDRIFAGRLFLERIAKSACKPMYIGWLTILVMKAESIFENRILKLENAYYSIGQIVAELF